MKKIMTGMFFFFLLTGGVAWGQMDNYAVYSKDQVLRIITEYLNTPQEKEDKVFRCPESKISDQSKCLTCHTAPTFKIKEANPDDLYDYPNSDTRIRIIDNKKVGFIYVSAIMSNLIEKSFDYFERHDIDHIIMEIHSGGGSLFEGWRVSGLMGEAEAKGKIIETRVYGFAASAAFLIAVSGTKGHRFANTHAELMTHELWTFKMFALETPSSSEEATRILRHLQDTGNSWLASRSNLTKEELDNQVKNREFWMTGEEAVKFGFMDGYLNLKVLPVE